jgi:hypothetical protein
MSFTTAEAIRVVTLENFHTAVLKWINSRAFDHQARVVILGEIARLVAEQAE